MGRADAPHFEPHARRSGRKQGDQTITMRWNKWRKRAAVGAGILAVFAVLVVCLCSFLGIRSRTDIIAYYAMMKEDFHPIWKDLTLRRIRKGDDIGVLLVKHTPLRREDFPPYTLLLFEEPFRSLSIVARHDKLIQARAASCTWEHMFFSTPEVADHFNKAYARHMKEILLDSEVFRIRRTVLAGQSVFNARMAKDGLEPSRTIVMGSEFYASGARKPGIVVDVIKVFHGNIEEGIRLWVPTVECKPEHLTGKEIVFLHVADSRVIYPHTQGGELCLSVTEKALDRYLSLTSGQMEELEARCLARWPSYFNVDNVPYEDEKRAIPNQSLQGPR